MTRAQARRASKAAARRDTGGRLTPGRAVVVALALPVVGAVVDGLLGSGLGWAFAITAVIGAAVAALTGGPANRLWVAVAPPPVLIVITVAAELAMGKSSLQGGKGLTTAAVRWAVDGFPAMAAAEFTALAVLAARAITAGRGRRNHDA
jgi:hypothetical protein